MAQVFFKNPTNGKITTRDGVAPTFSQAVTFEGGLTLPVGDTQTITGAEAGNATINLYADESDDTADRWSIAALAASTNIKISNASLTGFIQAGSGELKVVGEEAGNAALVLHADEGDDTADKWNVTALAAGAQLKVSNDSLTGFMQVESGVVRVVGEEAGNASLILEADESDDTADSWTIAALAAGAQLKMSNESLTGYVQAESGAVRVVGEEAGNASVILEADESDDTADSWTIAALAASANLKISNESLTGYVQAGSGEFKVVGEEAGDAALLLYADEGDDVAADAWGIKALAAGGLDFQMNGTTVGANLTAAGALTAYVPVQVLAAAGSVQGDAGAITAGSNGHVHVTGADATKGVKLPAAVAGYKLTIKNDDTANAVLKVWPNTSDAINAIVADSALSMAAKTSMTIVAIDAVTWHTIPLLPS